MSVDTSALDLLAEIPLGRRNVLRVTREMDHGHDVVNLRVWFTSREGEARPGRDGVAFPVDHVDALLVALSRLKNTSPQPTAPVPLTPK